MSLVKLVVPCLHLAARLEPASHLSAVQHYITRPHDQNPLQPLFRLSITTLSQQRDPVGCQSGDSHTLTQVYHCDDNVNQVRGKTRRGLIFRGRTKPLQHVTNLFTGADKSYTGKYYGYISSHLEERVSTLLTISV